MSLLSIITHHLAYIDPGTGSIIVQAVVAAVAGAAIAAKVYWHRILNFFSRHSVKSDPSTVEQTESEE